MIVLFSKRSMEIICKLPDAEIFAMNHKPQFSRQSYEWSGGDISISNLHVAQGASQRQS